MKWLSVFLSGQILPTWLKSPPQSFCVVDDYEISERDCNASGGSYQLRDKVLMRNYKWIGVILALKTG